MSEPTVAVIGAGLCGLTAAYRLQSRGISARIFEAEDHVGGRVYSKREHGYIVDTGASALAESYTAYLGLVEELGLRAAPTTPYIGIFRTDRTHLLRMDRMLRDGLRTRLLSPGSKLRLARLGFDVARARLRGQLDYTDMRKAAPLDTETAREYALRALNDEIDAYLCDPIVRTMLIADSDKVSRVELFSGVANIFASRILALEGGQGALAEALASRVDVELSSPVTRVTERHGGVELHYTNAGGEHAAQFAAAIVTCPLPIATRICPDHAPTLGPLNDSLGYTQALTVSIGTTRRPDSPAFLVQLSSRDDQDVALMFLDHNKARDRAPDGHGLITACWETDAAARMMDAPDDEIVARSLETLYRVFPEVRGTVDYVDVARWRHALPHTTRGAYRDIGDFVAATDERGRIQFAADFMSAAGQNTAVVLAGATAGRIAALLGPAARQPTSAAGR